MATNQTTVSPEIQEAILRFIEYRPTARVSRSLRKLLMECLSNDSVIEDPDFKDLVYDIEGIFDLLDAIEAENDS